MNKQYELCVIMPVYNEQDAITAVLDDWRNCLDDLAINYCIVAYNDGSRAQTASILDEYMARFPERIQAVNKQNSGHGPTILLGYQKNAPRAEWLFQIDSDNEMGTELFTTLWQQRAEYDFLLGRRDGRQQAWPRKIISFISRSVVRCFFGKGVWDVNAPYRLMRTARFEALYDTIPSDTFAPNVIISGLVAREKLAFKEFQVPHQDRATGEVSIKKWKLLKAAMRSFSQTILYSFKRHDS